MGVSENTTQQGNTEMDFLPVCSFGKGIMSHHGYAWTFQSMPIHMAEEYTGKHATHGQRATIRHTKKHRSRYSCLLPKKTRTDPRYRGIRYCIPLFFLKNFPKIGA
ncbi:MAG: hypothetical protein DDT22_00986 [candidate division WS2 bacterium]|nr:hypothetical protein [Candidatus Lithacetigena glycinireducens]